VDGEGGAMRARKGPFVSAEEKAKKKARIFGFIVDTDGMTLYY
jgi:hypothetical protein